MDSKQDHAAESNVKKATAKGLDSRREAARCEQWDGSMSTWLKPKSPEHSNGAGRVRKREEYEEEEEEEEEKARLAWALKNWPTRDIPIPSIETPDEELEMPEPRESEEPAPKRQKSTSVDKFEILWHYLENNTPDMRSPTLFPAISPVSDLNDLPPSIGTDTSLGSSSLAETTVTTDDGEIGDCGEDTGPDLKQ